MTASEYFRESINLWIRSHIPNTIAVIDFDADLISQYYYPPSVGHAYSGIGKDQNHAESLRSASAATNPARASTRKAAAMTIPSVKLWKASAMSIG